MKQKKAAVRLLFSIGAERLQGRIGEQPKTAGRIILVGIGYYRKDKEHLCRIEMLKSDS